MRVLIVDDHPRKRAALRQQILSEWPQADVQEAPTLARGLALSHSVGFDALVLDLSLPDLAGLAGLAEALKALKKTPVVALSPGAEMGEASRALEMGVAAYLPRSMAAMELVPAMHRVLAGGRFVTEGLSSQLLGLNVDLPVDAPPCP